MKCIFGERHNLYHIHICVIKYKVTWFYGVLTANKPCLAIMEVTFFFTYTHDSYLGFQGGKYIKCVTLNNSH